MTAEPKQYLQLLQERNRAAKRFAKQGQAADHEEKLQREAGFNTYLSGANQDRVKEQRQRDKRARSKSRDGGKRKIWSTVATTTPDEG